MQLQYLFWLACCFLPILQLLESFTLSFHFHLCDRHINHIKTAIEQLVWQQFDSVTTGFIFLAIIWLNAVTVLQTNPLKTKTSGSNLSKILHSVYSAHPVVMYSCYDCLFMFVSWAALL